MRGGKSPAGCVWAWVGIRSDVGKDGGVGNENAPDDGSDKLSWGEAVKGGETRRSRSGSTGRSRGMLAILCWALEMVEQFEVGEGHAGQHQGQQVGG